MADLQKTIQLVFGGVDRTGGAIQSVGKNLDSIQGKVGNITGPLADITDSIIKVDAALAAAAVGITGYAIKISDDFQTAFAEIATIIGQPAENLQDFQNSLLEYSETSSQSLDEITQATYAAISAGVEYQDAIEMIAAAEQLSIAGKADLGDTTRALVSTLNAFGAEANEAGAYADDFFTAVQLGQTTIPELADTIGRLAPIAAAAGLEFGEMAAAIATITAETGTGTAETITGIRAAINNLLKPTKEASQFAEELGIEFNVAALESKGFSGVLADVQEATGGNTEQMAKLFTSVEALAPVLALTGNASEAFADNMEKFTDNSGAAGSAADQLAADLDKITQTLKNSLNSSLIAFAGNLTDESQNIVKSVTSIFNSMGDELRLEDGVFAPILDGMEGLFQDVDAKLQRIAEIFPEALSGIDVSALLESFGDLGEGLEDLMEGLFGEIDIATVDGLQEAMQRVVDAITSLVQVSSGIAQGLEPLFKALGEGIEQFEDLAGSTKETVGQILGIGKAVDTVLPAIGGLATGLESIGTGLTALAGAQGFKALIGNLDTVKGLAKGTGKFGLVGAALIGSFGAGYGIGTMINEYIVKPLEEEFGGSIGSWLYDVLNADELAELEHQFDMVNNQVNVTAMETAELKNLNDQLADSLDNTKDSAELDIDALNRRAAELVENANEQQRLNDEAGNFGGSQKEANGAIDELTQKLNDNGKSLQDLGKNTQEMIENNQNLRVEYDETTGKINSFSGSLKTVGDSMEDAAKKTEKAVEQSEEYRLKMEQIASDERIANIEASVSLDIAEVEANAQKVEAIAQGISDSFQSTGDVLSSLFGSDAPDWDRFGFETREQVKKENELRQEAMEQQKELTQAQIENIKERTKQMSSGDAMIKVDGSGLAPHLEAFMFEVLQNIQTRVNANGEEMLLGLRQ